MLYITVIVDSHWHGLQDWYDQFRRMVHEWCHLKVLKRFGHGHDPAGVEHTQEGECVILCPACPQPGKNLPDNWDRAPEDKKWVSVLDVHVVPVPIFSRWFYAVSIAINANFHLKWRVGVELCSALGWDLGFLRLSSYVSRARPVRSGPYYQFPESRCRLSKLRQLKTDIVPQKTCLSFHGWQTIS